MTDYRKAEYKLTPSRIVDRDCKCIDCFDVNLSDDHVLGALRFSHELCLSVFVNDGHVSLASAWEIGCGGDWSYEQEDDFETEHPGLLKDIEDALKCGRAVIVSLIDGNGTVKTNHGEIPAEDYRDIAARQAGFDDYEDLRKSGCRLGFGLDTDLPSKGG